MLTCEDSNDISLKGQKMTLVAIEPTSVRVLPHALTTDPFRSLIVVLFLISTCERIMRSPSTSLDSRAGKVKKTLSALENAT